MKNLITLFLGLTSFGINAQQIQFLDLPSLFDREFEISGLTGNEDNLFLAAERCAKIFVVNKQNRMHIETINLNQDDLPDGIEIEGLSLYKDFLLITDEKNGNIFSYNLKTEKLSEIEPVGKDLSSFKGSYGMEGIAVDVKSKIVYVLRERNKNHQSEIHSFSISEKQGALHLKYRNQTLIQHENKHWRYAGVSIDSENKRLLCLKSYYVGHASSSNKREIEYISFDALTHNTANPNMLISLSKEVYAARDTYATNVEGIYSDCESIFVTSDNGEGKKDCSQKSSKTTMIKVKMY